MTEPEVLFPVTCPICLQETLTGFRISVVAEALETGEMRFYSNCHVASWNATEPELAKMRDYLDTVWSTGLKEASQEFFALDSFLDSDSLAFIYTGVLDPAESIEQLAIDSPGPCSDSYCHFEGREVDQTFSCEVEDLRSPA